MASPRLSIIAPGGFRLSIPLYDRLPCSASAVLLLFSYARLHSSPEDRRELRSAGFGNHFCGAHARRGTDGATKSSQQSYSRPWTLRHRHLQRSADGPRQDRDRDVVEHDRRDDFVGARDGLEDARDEAPERRRQMIPATIASGMAMIGGWSATATRRRPRRARPIRNWPWAPMLNRPALKPSATDSPARTSGAACDEGVDDGARAADRALDQGDVGGDRQRQSNA